MNDREPNDPNLDAPEKLRAALARSQSHRVIVPPAVDDAVLRASREHLNGADWVGRVTPCAPLLGMSDDDAHGVARPTRRFLGFAWMDELVTALASRLGGRRFAPLTAAAATIVAAGVLVWLTVHPRAAARPEDLNADGQVDMLDAFALARELQQGSTPRPQLDLNGDGVVDNRDVQALANRAVNMETGDRS